MKGLLQNKDAVVRMKTTEVLLIMSGNVIFADLVMELEVRIRLEKLRIGENKEKWNIDQVL